MNKLDFYLFHLMPYPYIPPGEEIESTWVTLSNSHYDPEVGHRLYNDYLEELIAAEKLGYDGVCVNEHHQNAYGTMPSPDLMAAYIAAKTERIPIGIIGNALPLQGNPLRVAEEIAMLDVISGGRIISGFVRGTGMEYYSYGANPSYSQERFWEAHDLIIKAWTEPGPFHWQGKHFNLPFVNPWPRPLQQPHPPIWLPGSGSFETIKKAAKLRYPFMMVFAPQWFTKASYDPYRQAAEENGYEASSKQLAAAIPSYVAETEEQAHREAKPHLMWLFQNGLKIPPYHWFPPGYVSKKSFANMLGAKVKHNMKDHWELSYEELLEERYIDGRLARDRDRAAHRVHRRPRRGHRARGRRPHRVDAALAGDQEHQLMAEEVIPHFREPDGKPTWAREDRHGRERRAPSMRRPSDGRSGADRALNGDGFVETERCLHPGDDPNSGPQRRRRGDSGEGRLNGDPDPKTEELQAAQEDRLREERAQADEAPTEDEASQHARRADKAAYLREKLSERAESERKDD